MCIWMTLVFKWSTIVAIIQPKNDFILVAGMDLLTQVLQPIQVDSPLYQQLVGLLLSAPDLHHKAGHRRVQTVRQYSKVKTPPRWIQGILNHFTPIKFFIDLLIITQMKSEVGIQKLMAISINNVPSSDVPEMSKTPLLRRQLHMQGPRGGTRRQRGGRARGWQGHRAPERGAGAHLDP